MKDSLEPWYSSVEAQRAFLTLPEDDQRTLELKHRIEANAMNVIYRAKEVRTNLPSEKSIFLEPIDSLNPLSQWIKKILHEYGIHYIAQLVLLPKNVKFEWLWEKKSKDISNVLDGFGLHFGMPIPEQDIIKITESFHLDDPNRELCYGGSFSSYPWHSTLSFFKDLNMGDLGRYCPELVSILNSNGIFYYGQIGRFTRERLRTIPGMTEEMMDELDSISLHTNAFVPSHLQIPNDRINQFAPQILFWNQRHKKMWDAMSDFGVTVMLDNWLEKDIPDSAMKAYQSRQQES